MVLIEISCAVQMYAWGKIGKSSEVAQLQSNNPTFKLQEDQPYAEAWFGTHPSGPSRIKGSNGLLSDELFSSKETAISNVGTKVFSFLQKKHQQQHQEFESQNYLHQLPFLLKVLSVNKALSIQAHPDIANAQDLHKKFPEIYKDPNHKPEMAIALTEFETLCQFRPFPEIVNHLKLVPQLRAVVFSQGEKHLEKLNESDLPTLFSQLMRCPNGIVQENLNSLVSSLRDSNTTSIDPSIVSLVLRLDKQFPGDVGLFSVFFLNYVVLSPGEGVFLAANEPHAYISGDCVECMACSDNVIRAGLTPKFKDIETLCRILTYKTGLPRRLTGFISTDGPQNIVVYQPPPNIPEFQVYKCMFSKSNNSNLPVSEGPSIFFVYSGSGTIKEGNQEVKDISKGSSYFVSSQSQISVEVKGDEDLVIFLATCNQSLFIEENKI